MFPFCSYGVGMTEMLKAFLETVEEGRDGGYWLITWQWPRRSLHVCRFLAGILRIFELNEATCLDHVAKLDPKELIFDDRTPGGKRAFVRTAITKCKAAHGRVEEHEVYAPGADFEEAMDDDALEAAFARILGKHHKKKQLPAVDMPAKLKELNLFDHFPEEVCSLRVWFSGCAYMCVRRCGRPRHR